MYRRTLLRIVPVLALTLLTGVGTRSASAQANPKLLNYGWGQIVANPHYPIVGETATISATISNGGTAPATNVQVKLSFNDWGVTFNGWQQMGTTQIIPVIAPGASVTVSVTHVFQSRTHTCIEALIVGADQNDDLTDDRGQINLEVVNSGETFSYDVPVVNNGPGALDAGVNGQLFFREGQGAPGGGQIPVEVVPNQLHLEPGETALVHVELDLAALPPGPLMLRIEAVDQNDANVRNNVVFDIRRTTAYQLHRDALAALQALRPTLPRADQRNKVRNAIGHIQKSMELRNWKPGDENRLARKAAAIMVYSQGAAAAHILEGLLGDDIGLNEKVVLDEVVRRLCDADRILTETAIADAGGHPAAAAIRQEGDDEREEGEYPSAMGHYGLAWLRSLRP